jgi:hypothetical protein
MGTQIDLIKYYGKIWQKMNHDSDLCTLRKMNLGGVGGDEPLFAIRHEKMKTDHLASPLFEI